ncbi:cation diffusion facilitator family transporter [Variovorax sp. PCZ-1]|uniref:cation diffusion facilitator family transporter n=1 Tax=Variovorax sp. PCZ-1 TaxID=2835533 RepID=UPI001BCCC324|nr:cation diffusion facilitator family transporter [Variovorax sp. PCZ-1]MBS7808596.1 cation transporter [Variovorax sp. PCZ-1]
MGSDHTHAIPENKKETTLWIALGLTSTFLIAEAIAGIVLNSLALLADAAHMFTDAAALAIALAAVRIAKRPADAKHTYGYHRFEILAAAFNAILLFAVAFYILFEAYQRFRNPAQVQTVGMLVVASLGLIINLISMRLLSADKDSSLNIKGAYLEVWSDMLGSLGVIIAAIVIYFTGWIWVDSLVAAAIGLWVLPRTWVLLKESLNILLEGTPEGLSLDDVSKAILAIPGITSLHDLHVWVLTSGKNSMTVHVVHAADTQPAVLIEKIQQTVAELFNVLHTTIQCELVACEHSEDGCNFSPQKAEESNSHQGHQH